VELFGEQHMFGAAVASLGDINNDGFADVIVGAPGYLQESGSALIFFGGNPMNNSYDISLKGENIDDGFGCSVASCGDVNNDGVPDIIVGARQFYPNSGKAYIFYGGNLIDEIPDIELNGEGKNDGFGCSVASGYLNNDNAIDILVGASNYNKNGAAYVYFGEEPPLTSIIDINNIPQNIIKVFPNPASNIINIVSDKPLGTIRIADFTARCLYQTITSDRNIVIDISNFENGIYILSINGMDLSQKVKIIKQ
jgi:hypothetical protein